MVSLNLTAQALRETMEQVVDVNVEDASAPMQNRTADSRSPFVSGHKDSLIHWQQLDEEAVERAKKENKLIYMHIGFRACHYCRLMDLESFSNADCVSILNQSFIPVLVDKDERPDIDITYMNYVQAVSNVGGWPLNLFLTPSLEPVFGGTYWPGPGTARPPANESEEEEDVLDFCLILKKMKETWESQEARCRREATEVVTQLTEFAAEGVLGTKSIPRPESMSTAVNWQASALQPPIDSQSFRRESVISTELDLDQLEEAYRKIAGTLDPVYGGFGLAPKFLTPPKLLFLLQLLKFPRAVQDVVGEAECKHAQTMGVQTLRYIRDGALRDHVDGNGFFRCSVTPDWSLPNFEKLTVDNALLLVLYLEAWKASGGQEEGEFLDVVLELVTYLTTPPIALPRGGFASSEAADSLVRRGETEMAEGAYHVWTSREFITVTRNENNQISQVAAAHWGIEEDGNVNQDHDPGDNFVNQNTLRVVKTPEELAIQFDIPVDTVKEYIQMAKRSLKAVRDKDRVRPEIDDKVMTGWNGLVVSALAQAAIGLKSLNPSESAKCLDAAKLAVSFIKDNLWDVSSQDLYRIWKGDKSTKAFADDYAYLISGLLDLYEATSDKSYLEFAEQLTKTQKSLFYDPNGGFFMTAASSPYTILRLKDGMDTSLPSTNATSVSNLFRLGKLLGNEDYVDMAKDTINAFEAEMLQYPWFFPGLLSGVVTARLGDSK